MDFFVIFLLNPSQIIIGKKKMISMVESQIKNFGTVKQNVRNYHRCPECGENIEIGIEIDTLKELQESSRYPYPHIHLHGNPIHGMLCYIDAQSCVRSVSVIKSIELSRDSDTFGQMMKKWSNPF